METSRSNGFLSVYALSSSAHQRLEFPPADLTESSADEFLWIHLDRKNENARRWLRKDSGLSSLLCDALLAEETRPRMELTKEGLLLILRGVNLNPGADPEDMVSIRLWSDGSRLISLRGARVLAVSDIEESLETGKTFQGPGDLILSLSTRLINRMGPVVDSLQEGLDDVEEALLGHGDSSLRSRLSDIRRQAVALRRYLSLEKMVLRRFWYFGRRI